MRSNIAKAVRALTGLSPKVLTRVAYYDGNHPSPPGSEGWARSHGMTMSGYIDNQVPLVVDSLAEDVLPASFESDTGDAFDVAYAEWLTKTFKAQMETLVEAARQAEKTGVQTTVAVDYDSEGNVAFLLFDPTSCYVQRDRAGGYLWAVHLWRLDDEDSPYTQATVYYPDRTEWWTSTTTNILPSGDEFQLRETRPNPFGELTLACVDKGRSIVDLIRPMQDSLNKSIQHQNIAGEGYILRLQLFLGFDTFNSETGTHTAFAPTANPATGSKVVSFPTAQDEVNGERKILEPSFPEPEKYLKEQDSYRMAIARAAKRPPSSLMLGASPPSGEALEITERPEAKQKATDERYYQPFWNRLGRLAIRRDMLKLLDAQSAPEAPPMTVVFTELDVMTQTSRNQLFTAAINAGMTMEDALVEFLGFTTEAAAQAAANSKREKDEAVERQQRSFERGLQSSVSFGSDTTDPAQD